MSHIPSPNPYTLIPLKSAQLFLKTEKLVRNEFLRNFYQVLNH